MIGERVQLVREYLSMTQQGLAEAANVTQSAISQIEQGGPVSDATLQSIARVTGYNLEFFRRGVLPDLPALSLRYRKRASSRQKDDRRLRAHCRQGIELIEELERYAQLPGVALSPVNGDLSDQDIEALAVPVRQQLGIGPDDPIPNVIRAVERAGVVVFGASVNLDKHDAVSVWPDFPAGRPIVCYARGWSGDRQRFSIAHEIGHIVLHQTRLVEADRAETEASRFGAALLIPPVALEAIEAPVTLRRLAWAKAKWGVSIAALIRRCYDLRIIDTDRYASLMKQLSSRGWRKEEPVHVPVEQPALLPKDIAGSSSVARHLRSPVWPRCCTLRLPSLWGSPPEHHLVKSLRPTRIAP